MQDENHRYYRSRILSRGEDDVWYYWVNEETMYEAETHGTLSESYRSAVVSPALHFTHSHRYIQNCFNGHFPICCGPSNHYHHHSSHSLIVHI